MVRQKIIKEKHFYAIFLAIPPHRLIFGPVKAAKVAVNHICLNYMNRSITAMLKNVKHPFGCY